MSIAYIRKVEKITSHHAVHTCEVCKEEIDEGSGYECNEATVEAQRGSVFPEGDCRTQYVLDVCADCFVESVMPCLSEHLKVQFRGESDPPFGGYKHETLQEQEVTAVAACDHHWTPWQPTAQLMATLSAATVQGIGACAATAPAGSAKRASSYGRQRSRASSDRRPRMAHYFTSDLHIGHANVIVYSMRPFMTVDDMDHALIANWNARVTDQDDVHVLGDVALCRPGRAIEALDQMRGRKHLVFGNHDKRNRKEPQFLARFASVADLKTIKISDASASAGTQRLVLCHFAMLTWDQSHRGAWQLHGHSHGSLADDPAALRLDVGVDSPHVTGAATYAPHSYGEIKAAMAKKTWRPVDHHADRE